MIADPDQPPNEHQRHSWAFALSRNGAVTLRVPDAPGEYELRYLNRGRTAVMFSRRCGVGIPFTGSDLTTSAELVARAAAATQGDASQDDLALVIATFRLPPGLPVDSANWRAEPLDPDLPPEGWRTDDTGPLVTATLPPGRWRVVAEGMADTILSADVEIFPGQPNEFTVEMETMQVDSALTGDFPIALLPEGMPPPERQGSVAPAQSAPLAVEGSVTVGLVDADIIAGSGGFFPVDFAAPAGFTGTISRHDASGAMMLDSRVQVLPVPITPGPHEIRVIDSTGMLRTATGFVAGAAALPGGSPT